MASKEVNCHWVLIVIVRSSGYGENKLESYRNKMDQNVNLYCRLCAETKPSSKLLDLQQDAAKKGDLVEKLNRLNASFLDLTSTDSLPKTVCFVCTETLDNVLNFILRVQTAQNVLKDIFIKKIVKEEIGAESRSPSEIKIPVVVKEEDDSMQIKLEYDYELSDFDSNIATTARKARKRKKKHLLQAVLDALDEHDLPLSKLKCATWKDYPWLCFYCNSQFFTVSELIAHSTEVHSCCTPFRCIDCDRITIKSLNKFILHVSKHKQHLKLSCYLCDKKFSTKNEIEAHRTTHLYELQCEGCNSSFDTCEQLTDHIERYNKKTKKFAEEVTVCKICNKSFASSSNLKKHLQIHTVRRRDQTCEKCGKTFYDKGTLTSHLLLHEDSRKYKCEICKAGFRTASQLRNHVGIHGGPRPYSCDQCGRTFRLRTHLKSHLIIHTDSLPHICEYCSKAFRFKTILNQHLRQHTGVKPYSCEHCLREFTNWPNYNKHMKRRHSLDMSKKKHTPEGVFPVNPGTGEILPLPDASVTDEWKKQVMVPRQRGRPRVRVETNLDKVLD